MPFEIGNTLSAKSKRMTQMLERIMMEDDGKRLYNGLTKLMVAFEAGEPWAVEQVFNRVQGKPAQSLQIDDEGATVQFAAIRMIVVKPETIPNTIKDITHE